MINENIPRETFAMRLFNKNNSESMVNQLQSNIQGLNISKELVGGAPVEASSLFGSASKDEEEKKQPAQ
jgi:hypothetical protein